MALKHSNSIIFIYFYIYFPPCLHYGMQDGIQYIPRDLLCKQCLDLSFRMVAAASSVVFTPYKSRLNKNLPESSCSWSGSLGRIVVGMTVLQTAAENGWEWSAAINIYLFIYFITSALFFQRILFHHIWAMVNIFQQSWFSIIGSVTELWVRKSLVWLSPLHELTWWPCSSYSEPF